MHEEQEPLRDPPHDPLPDALRNWQVLEIDGQATTVEEPAGAEDTDAADAPPPASSRPEDLRGLQIDDRGDDVIVATLDNRRRTVECGATAVYTVTILNNGPLPATFQVQIEGWIDPQWVGDALPVVAAEPGQRAVLRLPLSPPRTAASEAGEYHFAVTVRSPQYGGRVARLGALLTVLPFDALEVRFLDLPDGAVSWLRRSATLPLAVANRGNRPAPVTLHAVRTGSAAALVFAQGGDNCLATLTLQPNQSVTLPLRVEARHLPLIGLQGRDLPVQVEARAGGPSLAVAGTQVATRPLIGPWQIAAGAGLAAAGAVGLLLVVALVFLLAQRSALLQAPVAAPAQAAPALVAPPPVIIVTLNQPAGAPAAGVPNPAGGAGASNFVSGAAPDPALPLVLPDQVSAPTGGGAAVAPAVAASASSSIVAEGAPAALPPDAGLAAAPSANQTYGQMFQEVGSRFDLDWRLLAAQAYVESGFDSLALSNSGAMGLMQVLPDTWREWAPAVEVSDPFDAGSSVLVAAAYLDYLRRNLAEGGYSGAEWMLVAYNWGPDRLNNFLADGGTWDTLPEVRRQYASEILRIAKSIP